MEELVSADQLVFVHISDLHVGRSADERVGGALKSILDTQVPGEHWGERGPEQLDWLDAELAEPGDQPELGRRRFVERTDHDQLVREYETATAAARFSNDASFGADIPSP
jgi:hypothetical protein